MQFALNLDIGNRWNIGNVLSLVLKFLVDWVDFNNRESLVSKQNWVPKLFIT